MSSTQSKSKSISVVSDIINKKIKKSIENSDDQSFMNTIKNSIRDKLSSSVLNDIGLFNSSNTSTETPSVSDQVLNIPNVEDQTFTEIKPYDHQYFENSEYGDYSTGDIDIKYYNQKYNASNPNTSFANYDVDIKDLLNDLGSDGDNKLANRMRVVSLKNKEAIINRAKVDRYTNQHYFTEELNNHANSIWWENDDYESLF
jgi:hypothetical protein